MTENLFGDILSDEAAVISGSLGMLRSASIGGAVGLYEPVHGSAPDIAGKGIANPLGAIASAAMLLRYSAKLIGEADGIEAAIRNTLGCGISNGRPCDLGSYEEAREHHGTGGREGHGDRLRHAESPHGVSRSIVFSYPTFSSRGGGA